MMLPPAGRWLRSDGERQEPKALKHRKVEDDTSVRRIVERRIEDYLKENHGTGSGIG